MTTDKPTYQQFLDAAAALGDRKAYDAGLAALIKDEGPRLDASWSEESATHAMLRRAAWLAVHQWRLAQAQAGAGSNGSPPSP